MNIIPKLPISENALCITVSQAIDLLKKGDLVGLPTETVYGLAAVSSDIKAINKIFSLKKRPHTHPLILHIHKHDLLENYAVNIPVYARILWENFSPGPLTLILEKQPHLSEMITGGQQTIAIRSPNHQLAQKILQKTGSLVAPSANPFGKTSPTSAAHVLYHFPDLPVVNGDYCTVGIESTIIDCTGLNPRILRHGEIEEQKIERILQKSDFTLILDENISDKNEENPRFSGEMKAHYAPTIPLALIKYDMRVISKIIKYAKTLPTKRITACCFYRNKEEMNTLIEIKNYLYNKFDLYLDFHYHQFVANEQYAPCLYDMLYSPLTDIVKISKDAGEKKIDLLFIGAMDLEKDGIKYKAVIERLEKAAYGSWENFGLNN